MRGGAETRVTKCSLGSMRHKVFSVRPPGTLASKTRGKGAIAEQPVHTRPAQGQSYSEQAVKRVGGHVSADAARNEDPRSAGRTDRRTPGTLVVTSQHAPMRQACITVAQPQVEETDGPKMPPLL